MSNPPPGSAPPGPPAGGPYYGTPPRTGGSSGCLKAMGITCLTLIVLGIIVVLASFSTIRGLMGMAKGVAQAQQDGQTIQRAVVAYDQKHGRYPPSLITLVTDGESDGRSFHSAIDPDPNPAHVSWIYTPPPNGAPASTPILTLPYQINVLGRTGTAHIVVELDGSLSSSSGASPLPPASNGGSYSNSP